jgi:hypothetical protein
MLKYLTRRSDIPNFPVSVLNWKGTSRMAILFGLKAFCTFILGPQTSAPDLFWYSIFRFTCVYKLVGFEGSMAFAFVLSCAYEIVVKIRHPKSNICPNLVLRSIFVVMRLKIKWDILFAI